MADSLELVPTLFDVGRQPEIAMAAKKPDSSLPLLFMVVGRMSVDIGQCWRMLQCVGRDRKYLVTDEISPISHTVPELLLLPVYMPLCYFRLSADIGDGTVETAVPKNRGVAVEISFLSGRGVK